MKILLLADVEAKYYWDYYEKGRFDGLDLIISAGDLEPAYLEFIATYARCPVLYVHGNHDTKYDETPPLGCICIDDTVYEYEGIRIAGAGGSMKYNYGSYQYSEQEMKGRMRRLGMKLFPNKKLNILVTHAPAFGINDGDDLPHMGFKCFTDFIEKHEPDIFVHGHVHMTYGRQYRREDVHGSTRVINAFEKYIIEI